MRFLDLLSTADWESTTQNAIATLRPEVIGLSVRNIDDQTMSNPQFLLAAAEAGHRFLQKPLGRSDCARWRRLQHPA